MICVISPAKKMKPQLTTTLSYTEPDFVEDAAILHQIAKKKKAIDLQNLMGISEKLATLNQSRFSEMTFPQPTESAQAALGLFAGDTYIGLDAGTLSDEDLLYAQDHLRILSGLYGLLKPLDIIQPYRLEMGTKLKNPRGATLYSFWGSKIAQSLNQTQAEFPIVINLASKEYFSAIDQKVLNARVITPHFKEWSKGKLKIISFSAKRARGMMARFIITNRIEKPDQIKKFDVSGYSFSAEHSAESDWTFIRS